VNEKVNENEWKKIKNKRSKDWKAAAYRLEKRSPELYKTEGKVINNNNLIVANTGKSFIEGIMNLAQVLETQSKELEVHNDAIDVEYELLPSQKLARGTKGKKKSDMYDE
jgi:hypothetical protein